MPKDGSMPPIDKARMSVAMNSQLMGVAGYTPFFNWFYNDKDTCTCMLYVSENLSKNKSRTMNTSTVGNYTVRTNASTGVSIRF